MVCSSLPEHVEYLAGENDASHSQVDGGEVRDVVAVGGSHGPQREGQGQEGEHAKQHLGEGVLVTG